VKCGPEASLYAQTYENGLVRRGRPLNIYLVYEFIVSSVALAESALLPSLAIGLAYKYLVSVLSNTDKFPYLITSHSPLLYLATISALKE
jgi:hypothetical protein